MRPAFPALPAIDLERGCAPPQPDHVHDHSRFTALHLPIHLARQIDVTEYLQIPCPSPFFVAYLADSAMWDGTGTIDQDIDIAAVPGKGDHARGGTEIARMANNLDAISFDQLLSRHLQIGAVTRSELKPAALCGKAGSAGKTDPLRASGYEHILAAKFHIHVSSLPWLPFEMTVPSQCRHPLTRAINA